MPTTSTFQYVEGDNLASCPKCYKHNISVIGTIHCTDGLQHDALKCNDCNAVYNKLQGGIQNLIEDCNYSPSIKYSFTANQQAANNQTNSQYQNGINSQMQYGQNLGSAGGYQSATLGSSGTYQYQYATNNTGIINTTTLDYNAISKLDSMISSLNNISNSSYCLNDISNKLSMLMQTIQQLMTQNQELMQKVISDPLIEIRKQVNDFNLT